MSSTFGEPLSTLLAGVQRVAERLTSVLHPEEAAALDQMLAARRGSRYRVAVLGQVKAGKSSLVNAMARRTNLSPVNVNPWTAVVCHLHFGGPIDPAARAVFTFFDEDDWAYLGSGGRMRELTERLGVTIDQEHLRSHLENTRKRAEQRLGRQFHHLLGRQHRFAEPSPELLARYVSMGVIDDDDDDRLTPKAGRFSDITKSAELFFDQVPFAYPTTIIDTPGTNDPLLVRDDLTQATIEDADAHIVVLTAEQALSTADVSLLRMLHGLHKERLLVFINRIDALEDLVEDVDPVVEHVRRQLAIEFPESRIPVVAGSARWAELALTWDERSAIGELPAALRSWAEVRGLPPLRPELLRSDGKEAGSTTDIPATIMAAAGITSLEEALRDVVQDGPAMTDLIRMLASLRSLQDDVSARLRNEAITLEQSLTIVTTDFARNEETQEELQRLEELRARLEAIEEPLQQDIDIVQRAGAKRMRAALEQVVTQFADEETESLTAAHRVSRIGRIWRCDTRPLRRRLEQTFLTTYDVSANELLAVEGEAWMRLEQLVNQLLADQKIKFKGRPPHAADPSPSISSLGTTVALDLGDQWERWWHRWQTLSRRARRFKELVYAEFNPITAVLLVTAQRELKEQGDYSLRQFAHARQQILNLLDERERRLERVRADLARPEVTDRTALIESYRTSLRTIAADLDQCESIDAAIRELLGSFDQGPSGPGAADMTSAMEPDQTYPATGTR
ncbi:MAG: dynamin family protein [Alphaproteobacteria bacterium]